MNWTTHLATILDRKPHFASGGSNQQTWLVASNACLSCVSCRRLSRLQNPCIQHTDLHDSRICSLSLLFSCLSKHPNKRTHSHFYNSGRIQETLECHFPSTLAKKGLSAFQCHSKIHNHIFTTTRITTCCTNRCCTI
jgi:hypothetical protein